MTTLRERFANAQETGATLYVTQAEWDVMKHQTNEQEARIAATWPDHIVRTFPEILTGLTVVVDDEQANSDNL